MAESERTAERLFFEALNLDSAEERSQFLEQECGDDIELRNQVAELLRINGLLPRDFLSTPPRFEEPYQTTPPHRNDPTTDETMAPHPEMSVGDEKMVPRRFGDYELVEKIAHGGMGVVFKARQMSLNRTVALKMILSGQFASPDEIRRFRIEAESAAGLDHPGIVPVFEAGCLQGQHYFAMGFVDGPSLAAELKDGPLPPRKAAKYLIKIAEAVQTAHDLGIVHRDLKPGNILMDKGEPRVTDFGLAKQVQSANELTATGMVVGTPSYMPPEQASGEFRQINPACDVYALGAILYEMLTGQPPFKSSNQLDTLIQVLNEEPAPPRQIDASIPKDLELICLKCLEKNPKNRYESARDLSNDLQLFLAGDPIGAKNDWHRRFRKWTIREPVLASHLAVTIVLMAFIGLNFCWFGMLEDVCFDGAIDPARMQDSADLLSKNWGILIVWALTVFVLQKSQNRFQTRYLLPGIWAAAGPLFLTLAIAINDPPRLLLTILYPLLMISTCFFRRVDLVAITGIASLIGFLVVTIVFWNEETNAIAFMDGAHLTPQELLSKLEDRPGESSQSGGSGLENLDTFTLVPRSYIVIVGVALLAMAVMIYMLALRMQRMSQKDSN